MYGRGTVLQDPGFLRERSAKINFHNLQCCNIYLILLSPIFWIGLAQSVSSLVHISVSRETVSLAFLVIVVHVEKTRLQVIRKIFTKVVHYAFILFQAGLSLASC